MSWLAALARGGDVAAEPKNMAFASGEGSPAGGALPTLESARSDTGLRINQATAMAVAAVRRCVSIRAIDVARCPPAVVRLDGLGNKVVVKDHELSALFRRPNQVQSWFEFAEQMHYGWVLRGNAYAVKIRDRRGAARKLIPVNPDLVTVLEAPDGSIFYDVSRSGMWLMAQLDGLPIGIPAEDVLHIRDLSANTLVGLSRIYLAREGIGLALAQEKQAARWIGNGARPSGVLQSDKKISKDAAARLKAQWQTFMSGLGNTGTTAVLEEGLKWTPMQLDSEDLEFIAARQMQVREIARWFDVPLHKLYEADSMTRASVAELNADYVQTTVVGDLTRWERRLEHDWDLLDEDLSVSFDERALLRADILTMRNVARLGVMSGLIEPNEGRVEIGYGPRPDGSGLRSPTNQAPNGSAVDGVAPDGAGRPSGSELPGDKAKSLDGEHRHPFA